MFGKAPAGVERCFKRVEIAVVDADHLAVQTCCPVQFGPVVHLDQGIHAPIRRRCFQLCSLRVRNAGHNDQNAICTQCTRLGHLIGVIHEILAQHRQLAGRARLGQKRFCALKTWGIRQYAQAGRAARLIGLSQRGRIEIRTDQPL